LTPVRTTNGATPRSSRAYQRRRGLSARPGAIADIDAPTEAAACVEIATRARHDARALVRGLPATHRLAAHPGRRRRCPTDTSPSQMRSPTTTTLTRRTGSGLAVGRRMGVWWANAPSSSPPTIQAARSVRTILCALAPVDGSKTRARGWRIGRAIVPANSHNFRRRKLRCLPRWRHLHTPVDASSHHN
jgi:hypothetical protein